MVLRPILRPIQRKILRPIFAAAQRIFITLNGTDAHFSIENPVTFAGDFDIHFEFETVETTGSQTILAGSVKGNNSIVIDIQDTGKLRFFMFTGASLSEFATSTNSYNDGRLHSGNAKLTGTTMSLTIDGDTANTATHSASGDENIQFIGQRSDSTNKLKGIIANVDLGNGNAWQLNRLTGNTEQAANGNNLLTYVNIPEGAPDRELFTKNTSTDPDQWENADKSRIIQIA